MPAMPAMPEEELELPVGAARGLLARPGMLGGPMNMVELPAAEAAGAAAVVPALPARRWHGTRARSYVRLAAGRPREPRPSPPPEQISGMAASTAEEEHISV